MIDGIEINELKIIENKNGNILHFLKNNEKSYKGFGEVYISTIKSNSIKAWKKHKKMTCNFIVPKGKIKIVVFDDRLDSISYNEIQEINLSIENYCRLTIPPNLWFGFSSLTSEDSLLINFADIMHDPNEKIDKDLNFVNFKNWFN
jgi:dTDP-4-dehydrorhamnose 3,5-epimerase